jgi:hypothetical protein
VTQQNYANHRRMYPLFHFVAFPMLAIFFFYSATGFARNPDMAGAIQTLFALGVVLLAFAARTMVLTVQNRIIRLEMQLRMARLLPAELAARGGELPPGTLVALRFASDGELPGLTQRALAGEFDRANDLKKAIQDWKGDHLRA